jgi:hypothetical protein
MARVTATKFSRTVLTSHNLLMARVKATKFSRTDSVDVSQSTIDHVRTLEFNFPGFA